MWSKYFKILILPWFIFFAGILTFKLAADTLGLDKEAFRPFALFFTGFSMIFIGLGRLNVICGLGIGLVLGTLVFLFADFPLPYTALGLLTATGLIIGTLQDRRSYREATGSRA